MELNVFARRYVAPVERRVRGDDFAHHVQLVGGHAAKWYLDAKHVDVGLSLSIDALPEPEGHEIGGVPVAGLEPLHTRFELIDLGGEVLDNRFGCRHSLVSFLEADRLAITRKRPARLYRCGALDRRGLTRRCP